MGNLLSASDDNQKTTIQREYDAFGNLLKETFPSGLFIEKCYDALDRPTLFKIDTQGEVHYTYDPLLLRKVVRVDSYGRHLYAHCYDTYDLSGNLLSEQLPFGFGQVTYRFDEKGRKTRIFSPYFSQYCKYDPCGNLILNTLDGIEHQYTYDDLWQLTEERALKHSETYEYDSLYNKLSENGRRAEYNDLNELLSLEGIDCSYDINGNLISKTTLNGTFQLAYDPLNRLVEASSEKCKVFFSYDPLGRRLTKTVHVPGIWYGWQESFSEIYLYDGDREIGAFNGITPKSLRVFGKYPQAIALELEGKSFIPLLDAQGNTCRLIDPRNKISHRL